MRAFVYVLLLAAAPELHAEMERSLPVFFFPNPSLAAAGDSVQFLVETPQVHAAFALNSVTFQIDGQNFAVRFPGGRATALEGAEPMNGHVNLLIGKSEADWNKDLAAFGEIVYRDLYPGIEMSYSGTRGRIKSEFRVAPHANFRAIRMEYSKDAALSIGADGSLGAKSAAVIFREQAPEIYQESSRGRVRVSGRYKLIDAHTVGFEIEDYDAALPLVIDPTISYSTYLGGSGLGAVTAVAIDSADNLYATGWTEALNFPIVGAVQAANQGGVDAFIVKLNSTGTSLLYATYLGGRGADQANGIRVDSSGNAYVAGFTESSNFPVVSAIRSTLGGTRAGFVLKLNPVGNTLLYSTYLGGTNYDEANAIAIDSSGSAYIAGDTESANFPVLNAAQSKLAGGFDSFVTKLTSAGVLSFSTFLGGSGNDHAASVNVDSSGNVYVTGGTYSTNFPVKGPIQSANGGGQDAFVAKLNSTGSSIVYSTYLGGNGTSTAEQGNCIVVDGNGNAYVAGVTNSSNFPVTTGAYQVTFEGVQDAFVAKLNAAGSALVYSTYLGGSDVDWASGIRVDGSGSAHVVGYTDSVDFPIVGGIQAAFGGLYDAFVAQLGPAGNSVVFSSYLGGSGSDIANAIALDSNGNMFLGGQTSSSNFPLAGAIQTQNTGGSTGWLTRIGVTAAPPEVPSAISVSPSSGSGNTVSFTAQYSDTGGGGALTAVSLLLSTNASTNYACYVSYSPSANQFTLANDVASSGSVTVVPGGGSQQNDQCTLNGVGSSATVSGSNLTMTISLSFQPGFAGSKSVYLFAADAVANTGWVSRGTWSVTVPPPQPSVDSVSPNGGSGSSQNFTFVFSDTQNAANLLGMAMLFNSTLSSTNACYLVYDATAGSISLLWDNGNGSNSKPIGSSAILQNSQCSVGATSVKASGLSDILTAAITFSGPFSGTKNIYMYASEGGSNNTGWVTEGTYTVAAGGVPVANSVVPASGSGPAQRFSFTVSDQGGSSYLTGIAVLFASSLNTTDACYLIYDRTANTVSLTYDIPSNGATPVIPGSSAVATNSQCALGAANTTVVVGTTSLVLTLDLSFSASWFGAKNVYLYASEKGANSGWVDVGAWTVTGGAPTADSVTPSSGSGSLQSFTFSGTDSASGNNITGMSMLFTTGSPSNTANACYLIYNRISATIGLYNNAATTLTTKPIGSSASLYNSQCAVGYTVMTTSGNSVLFSVQVLFYSGPFSGAKTVYLQTNEPSTNSGWVARGTWTVP